VEASKTNIYYSFILAHLIQKYNNLPGRRIRGGPTLFCEKNGCFKTIVVANF